MKTVLLVCTGNTCRSPMSQALFLKYLQQNNNLEEYNVISAGISTLDGMPASEEAIATLLDEEGIDISEHKSKIITEELISKADLILTMTKQHKNMLIDKFPYKADYVFTLSEFADGSQSDVLDPFGQGSKAYYDCYTQLKDLIQKTINKLE